jgi:hypothetical protein
LFDNVRGPARDPHTARAVTSIAGSFKNPRM